MWSLVHAGMKVKTQVILSLYCYHLRVFDSVVCWGIFWLHLNVTLLLVAVSTGVGISCWAGISKKSTWLGWMVGICVCSTGPRSWLAWHCWSGAWWTIVCGFIAAWEYIIIWALSMVVDIRMVCEFSIVCELTIAWQLLIGWGFAAVWRLPIGWGLPSGWGLPIRWGWFILSKFAIGPGRNLCSEKSNPVMWRWMVFVWNVALLHDNVIKWKHFPRYWPFVWGIHPSPVNSPHKDQWHGTLMLSLICAWIKGWLNNGEAGDLRRHCAHNDVTVMESLILVNITIILVPYHTVYWVSVK